MDNLSMLTDLYEFSMANGYRQTIDDEQGVFDIFFRKVPDSGSFVICAGLQQIVESLKDFHFSKQDVDYLRSLKLFKENFLDYLSDFHFDCQVSAIPEGTPVFSREPLLTIQGPLLQTQLFETLLLNIMNHQSLIATKARRITFAAGDKPIMEFGARRAQGPSSATFGARAAVIGGCASTSNVLAAEKFGIPAAGTMAHAWIEAFPDELTAFEKWADVYPDNASLLVDTYDVLKSGVPNAITVFTELKKNGHKPVGIRIDSGDITQLAKGARKMLDDAGFPDTKITASNALDEHVIQSLLNEGAPLDNFGVGEKLITSSTSPVLSGVYKLAAIVQNGKMIPKIKVSASREKLTLPGLKQVYRLYRPNTNQAFADIIALNDEVLDRPMDVVKANPIATERQQSIENYDAKPLQEKVMDGEKVQAELPDVFTIQKRSKQMLKEIPSATQRLVNPDEYPVYMTLKLAQLQENLVVEEKK
ncbi:Nicotinate phosphoribosyltransferase [Lentilactobacillus hilgardii]|uniref:nicotinate phosphoribosyltransferase n=1 Tax=Lentilactobacillus hilgardii TaxID=1588 RepID=UPI00019C5457|nr:nicotinate phosphoribosyltransferase [Lentilactobacillus hilgardii]EEI20102.1 nicotinate phosphoribosyltransferase [Lentilactobacillus buchneri ATCC 11577]MCT3396711.1 nicotinate phosphoribosyltransferase [Lentilactobacillus hilgardii]QIR08857.1 Nicotinate phosphoribosyltransferase [Lentilactobacillus hilgardii]